MSTDKTAGLQYRVNIFTLSGELLASTEFTLQRDKIVFLHDAIRETCHKKIQCSIETKAIGYIQPPQH